MTKLIRYTLLMYLPLLAFKVTAQDAFVEKGKIFYEKKINLHKEVEGTAMESFKSSIPTYYTTYHTMFFDRKQQLYTKTKDPQARASFLLDELSSDDAVYIDLVSKRYKRKTGVSGETFLVQDTLSPIQWKITDETREISGFDCFRAETILYDSIYVIAFFCPQIEGTAGPLLMHGLPGMILGLVVPRLNMTIFATKIEMGNLPEDLVSIFPLNITPMNFAQYKQRIDVQLRLRKDRLKRGLLRSIL